MICTKFFHFKNSRRFSLFCCLSPKCKEKNSDWKKKKKRENIPFHEDFFKFKLLIKIIKLSFDDIVISPTLGSVYIFFYTKMKLWMHLLKFTSLFFEEWLHLKQSRAGKRKKVEKKYLWEIAESFLWHGYLFAFFNALFSIFSIIKWVIGLGSTETETFHVISA